MNIPVKTRLTLWYITLFTLIVGVWCVFVIVIARASLQANTDRTLSSRAAQIVADFAGGKDAEFPGVATTTLKGLPRTESVSQLLSATGEIVEYSGDEIGKQQLASWSLVRRTADTGTAQLATVTSGGENFRILVVRVPQTDRFVLVGSATETTDNAIDNLVLVMLLTGPLALIGAALGGWFLAGRALRPVSRMTRTASVIGINDLDARVAVPSGNDEFTELAKTLNGMLERLDDGVRDKRRLVSDASHELQTPLAVMRTEIDVALAADNLQAEAIEVLESAREETDRMSRLVRNLLTLARFDEGTLRLLRAPTDLAELAADTVASLEHLAADKRVNVELLGEPAWADADVEYLRLVAVNLIENAIKYSGADALVSVETRRDGADALLIVTDTGPGIAPAAAKHVFDRFYRADPSRAKETGGTGLGLSITQEIVQAHGGSIELDTRVNEGSRFTVRLPAIDPPEQRA